MPCFVFLHLSLMNSIIATYVIILGVTIIAIPIQYDRFQFPAGALLLKAFVNEKRKNRLNCVKNISKQELRAHMALVTRSEEPRAHMV